MACCAPNNAGPGLVPVDSCKRVNYTLGMLMGVDDFVQESAYNGSRRRELARELLGYGTVHGLQVVVEPDGDNGPRMRVTPGMAWLPSGTPVCVDADQCANLKDWLAAHQPEVQAALADQPVSPPRLTLYLVLSYLDCLTDNVPIPGEPCRSEAELMQPSRIADGFRLELRLAPPQQREEDALRDFVDWLVRLPLAPTSPPLDEAAFIDYVRDAARDWLEPTSPPASPPDYMTGAAPAGTNEALFHAALRLWATELRPLWMARPDCGCTAAAIGLVDDAVLLAQLDIDLVPTLVGAGWSVSDQGSAVTIDEGRRPVLLNLRTVQELILRQWGADPGNMVVPETAFGQLPDSGSAVEYARADHTHGSPALPPLAGDVTGAPGINRIALLQGRVLNASNPAPNQMLRFVGNQWVAVDLPVPPPPPAPTLAGDVTGPVGTTRLAGLQGRVLNAPNPTPNQILRFVGNQWVAVDLPVAPPVPAPTLAGDVTGPVGTTRLASLQGRVLNAPNPAPNQMLRFVGNQWVAVDLPIAPPVPAPTLAGDVTGPMGTTRLASLQGRTLNAPNPQADQVLRFTAGQWRAVDLPAAPPPAVAEQCVGRGTPAQYEIVAAGGVEVARLRNKLTTTMTPSPTGYGGLAGQPPTVNLQQITVELTAVVKNAEKLPNYIVKLTPIWTDAMKSGFQPYLLEGVKAAADAITFQVMLLTEQVIDGGFKLRFQVEVSRF